MKKILLYSLFLGLNQAILSQSTFTYKAYFDFNQSYCPGDSQYDHWVDFITSLDTNSNKFLRLTMRGTYDMAGKTCTDRFAVRKIADALKRGYDATVSCQGNNWSVGTGCSDFNCGSYSDYIELTLNPSTCNCGVSYTVRPGTTSANWGGMATETCQAWYPGNSQYMMVDMTRVYGLNNLSLNSLLPFDECSGNQAIVANVANEGTNTVTDYMIGYSINGVLQNPVTVLSQINSDATALITLTSAFAFTANTIYAFRVWTYNPNGTSDPDVTNDTFRFVYKHAGIPATPTAGNVISCGHGPVKLSAGGNDSIAWYDEISGGSLLGIGKELVTPYLHATDTFYAESLKFRNSGSAFGTGFNNYTTFSNDQFEYNGGMLNVSVKDVLSITGIKVQSVFSNATPHYKVYMKEGEYGGHETDSTKWTRIFDAELSNGAMFNTIPVNVVLNPNVDYAFYVTTDPANGEDIWVNFGNYVYSNQDISVEGGTLVYGKFGSVGVYTPFSLDMEFIYNKPCKSVARKPVIVTVNPRPSGSEIIAASGFKGQEEDGTSSRPDISTPGLTLNYELTSPAGFLNAEYGSKWILDSVSLITAYGKKVSSSLYSFTIPDSADNGFLSFTPDKSLLDSSIAIRLRCRDLGPYFCDTVITRVIHVAPIPKPGFKVLSTICEGSEVYFSNLSSIHSGRMNYKWYFSSTDSSDIFEPIYRFDSFGVYPVRLVVTSEWYNIVRDTTIMVNINGIPDVDFSVENACEGNPVKFTNLTPGNTALMNFRWDFGDRTPFSTVLDPTHPYNTPGTYKVTLTANLNGCGDTIIKNAHLYSKPVVDFMPPAAEQCLGENWFFINNSYIFNGKMGALWDFSDGGHSTFFNATHMFTSTGTYPVRLKMISEFDCADSLVKVITVKPIPVINFMTDKLCSLDSTRFTNLTNEIQGITSDYTWTFSDGPEQHTRNVSRKWASHGPKTVKLVSSLSNGCRAEKETTLNVLIQPEANFNVKDICANENAVFVNTSKVDQGEMDFMWDFGDGSGIGVPNPKHQYTISKTKFFTVTLVAKADQGCSDTVKRIIRVHEVPDCGFTFSPFSPIGNKTFRFVPVNSTYEEYEWFFGEGGSSKNKTPIYQYLYNGSYTVVLRAKNSGGCICEQTIYLKVDLTGLSDKYEDAFSIYPNPADQSVSIRLKDAKQGTAKIYNQVGQLVKTVSLDETTEIETGELSPGIYVVEVILDDRRFQARITVVH